MKYIRTNKEILYLVSEPIYADDGACEQDCYECITSKGKTRYIYENDIVKKADNIEELCDEYIVRDNENKEYRPLRFYFLKDLYDFIKENKLFERYKVYGSIWTDKGLIYVARMNEKGELELL